MSADHHHDKKGIFRELRAFAMRDLQDYRFADYENLSRKSRYTLLLFLMPVFILLLFFLWRYVLGNELLSKNQQQRAALTKQVDVMSTEIADYQRFFNHEYVIALQERGLLSKVDEGGNPFVTEITLIALVESLITKYPLQRLALFPRREMMMIEHLLLDPSKNFRKASISESPLITQLKPISEEVKLQQLRLAYQNPTEAPLSILKLEIELEICGEYPQLFMFLAQLQQEVLQQGMALLYLEKLLMRDAKPLCQGNVYELTLQFYDPVMVHQAYLALGSRTQNQSFFSAFPQSLPQVKQYLARLMTEQEINKGKEGKGDDFYRAIKMMFRETLSSEASLRSRGLQFSHQGDSTIWRIGERYQGMLLAGIVVRDSRNFAIVKMKSGQWQMLQVGDLEVIEITPKYLVMDDGGWE